MVMLDRKNAISKLSYNELKSIDGGVSFSGTLVNAFTSGMKTIFEIGRSLGNALRRMREGKLCEIL